MRRDGPSRSTVAGAVLPSSSSTPRGECASTDGDGDALDVDDVRLLDLEARMREPIGKRAVVHEQQDAGRGEVEASNRHTLVSPPTSSTTVGLPSGSEAVVIT